MKTDTGTVNNKQGAINENDSITAAGL